MEFRVEEQDGEIIVTDGVFTAVYHKPDKLDPQLKLRSRTPTDDHALLAASVDRGSQQGARVGMDCVDKQKPRGCGNRGFA